MKQNKFYWMSLLLCTLALGFTSCEKEEGRDEEEPIGFGSEKYESISGLYEVENTDCGIKSVELTAGGEYIIVFTGNYGDYSLIKSRGQRESMFAVNRVTTRNAGENYITGTYTYNEDNSEIILDGYGSLLVYSLNSDGTFDAFVLSTDDGDKIELDVTKREELPNSTMTQNLCRTWKPQREEYIIRMDYGEIKNQIVLDAKYSYSTGEITISKNLVEFTEEDLEEMFNTSLRKAVFSKVGTYMVYHEYDGYEESSKVNWKWNDEKAGYLLYYWDDEQDYEYSDEGIVQISFIDNTLCVSESVEFEEYGASMLLTSKMFLVEAN